MSKPAEEFEQHPLLPSGYWTGFYVYKSSAERHDMLLMLDFIEGRICGSGQDDVGAFTFSGNYDLQSMTCRWLKHYRTHEIEYHGHIDGNGIWGTWNHVYSTSMGVSEEVFNKYIALLGNSVTGGFHIWPSSREFSAHEMEIRKIKEEEVVRLVQFKLV